MDSIDYGGLIGRYVKIILKSDFYYRGQLLAADKSFLKIKDKTGKLVLLSISEISTLEEAEK
jgi:small nuclear ribonucleoprotein (snRNP)-like protein